MPDERYGRTADYAHMRGTPVRVPLGAIRRQGVGAVTGGATVNVRTGQLPACPIAWGRMAAALAAAAWR